MLHKSIFVAGLLFSSITIAKEPGKAQVFSISGMHCEACVQTLTKNICEKNGYAACEVKLTNAKNELGELRITPKEGQTVDAEKLRTQIGDLGYKMK